MSWLTLRTKSLKICQEMSTVRNAAGLDIFLSQAKQNLLHCKSENSLIFRWQNEISSIQLCSDSIYCLINLKTV